jgi:hypothetical protein
MDYNSELNAPASVPSENVRELLEASLNDNIVALLSTGMLLLSPDLEPSSTSSMRFHPYNYVISL